MKNINISKALKGRKLSTDHKKNISESLRSKPKANKNVKSIAFRLLNNHHNRYEWLLINPQNKLVRTSELIHFCTTHELSYSAFRCKAQKGDSRPISRGASKGWTVFAVKKSKL